VDRESARPPADIARAEGLPGAEGRRDVGRYFVEETSRAERVCAHRSGVTLGLQVAVNGKQSASRNTLLQEVSGSFEGLVIATVGVRGLEAGDWGFGLRLALERRLGRVRGECDRLRTGAGKK
jgi:hypothetical protein